MTAFKHYDIKPLELIKLLKSRDFKLAKAEEPNGSLRSVEGSKLNYYVLYPHSGSELYYMATVLPLRLETRFMVGGGARNDHFHITCYKQLEKPIARFKNLKTELLPLIDDDIQLKPNKTDHYLSTFDLGVFIAFYKATRLKETTANEVNQYLLKVYNESNDIYHQGTGESKLSDKVFDELRKYLILQSLVKKEKVGADPVAESRKVDLETPLGSLENAFDQTELKTFFKSFTAVKNFVHTPKIDGISAQVNYVKGVLKGGNTKGNGYVGEDITALLKVIPAVPKKLLKPETVSIRCELFMNNSVFIKKYGITSNRAKKFKTARNMVAGQKNRNTPDVEIAKDIKVLGYEILNKLQDKREQLDEIKSLGFPVVPYVLAPLADAKTIYTKFKQADYLQDGSVVEINDKKYRTGFVGSGINPKAGVAFKPETEEAKTTITSVKWTISKDGYFKPTIYFEPVTVGGVTVQKASVHNAKKVKDQGLNPEAIITIVRSGDAIPHVKATIKPTKFQPPKGTNWTWNSTGVDIILKSGESSESQEIEKIIIFFSALKVERFSEGLIRSFYNHGFKTIPDILHMTKEQIIKEVPRQGDTSAQNIITEFKKLKDPGVPLYSLLYASGCFGRGLGEGKFKDLYAQYGDDLVTGWQGSTLSDIAASIDEIPGFSYDTGKQYAQGIKPFIAFYRSIKDVIYVKKRKSSNNGPLKGEIIVFSGFRSKEMKERIEELGGEYSETLSRKTTILVSDSVSKKTEQAEKNGTRIISRNKLTTMLK